MQNQKNIDMKKLLFLLLLPFVFACSSDKDNGPSIDYIDNSLIEGKWVFVQGTHTYYRTFENNTMHDETYHTYDKDLIGETYYGEYKLSKEHIYYRTFEVPYTLKDDVLTFTYSSGNIESYTKVKE